MSLWLVGMASRQLRTTAKDTQTRKFFKITGYVALAASCAGLTANIFGYVTLTTLIGNALLQSSYFALILYAAVEALDGLVIVALSAGPFAALGTVSRHQLLLRRRIRRVLQSLGLVLWLLALLQRLLLRERIVGAAHELLTAKLSFGSIHISPSDVLAFIVTVWAAFCDFGAGNKPSSLALDLP